jgi:hypothetical protein
MPGLGAVADDGEAAGRAPGQQHLPLGVGQLLGLVDDHVCERPGEQVGVGAGLRSHVHQCATQVLATQHRHDVHVGVVGRDEMVDDVGHLLLFSSQDRIPLTPAP